MGILALRVDDASNLEYLVVVEHLEAFHSRVKDNLRGVLAARGLFFDYVLVDPCLLLSRLLDGLSSHLLLQLSKYVVAADLSFTHYIAAIKR